MKIFDICLDYDPKLWQISFKITRRVEQNLVVLQACLPLMKYYWAYSFFDTTLLISFLRRYFMFLLDLPPMRDIEFSIFCILDYLHSYNGGL